MVKKKSVKKNSMAKKSPMGYKHRGNVCLVKIASMAFILFLIQVWPWLNRVLLGVHWGIYLGIVILVMIFLGSKSCKSI